MNIHNLSWLNIPLREKGLALSDRSFGIIDDMLNFMIYPFHVFTTNAEVPRAASSQHYIMLDITYTVWFEKFPY